MWSGRCRIAKQMMVVGLLLTLVAVAVGAAHDGDHHGWTVLRRMEDDTSTTTNAVVPPSHVRSRRRREHRRYLEQQQQLRHQAARQQSLRQRRSRQRRRQTGQEGEQQTLPGASRLRRRTEDALDLLSHDRLIGGSRASVGQYPYFAHMLTKGSGGQIVYDKVCGGVLIAPEWILTAAHCLYERDTNTVDLSIWGFDVGFYCRFTANCGQSSTWVEMENLFAPSEYDPKNFFLHDAGLVKLKEPVHNIQYARPDDGRWYNSATPYQMKWTALGRGYSNLVSGMSDFLEYADMTLMDTRDCENEWGRKGELQGRVFCMLVEQGVTPCTGDSGGPVLWRDLGTGQVRRDEDGRHVVTGLVIGGDGFGEDCLEANRRPPWFVQVSTFFPLMNSLICSSVSGKPSWCPSTPQLPTSAPSAENPNFFDGGGFGVDPDDAKKGADGDSDDGDCDGIQDVRWGSFQPKLSSQKVKTCKWLAKKSEKKQRKFCGNPSKSNAPSICARTCCEAMDD